VVLRYCTMQGREDALANPNGSRGHIAGISNAGGNVVGMMPHPERCCSTLLGGSDGRWILGSAVEFIRRGGLAVG
jgi:phosphoribosylformylglycinamidine synthase